LKLAINSGKYFASELIEDCLDSSIKIICVPTPLDDREKPDLKPLESAAANVGKILKRGNLIILESTVAPFTTRDFLLPILERESALSSSEFELAYSPERIDPANEYWDTITTPKIVSGINENSLRRASKFYSQFIKEVFECSSIEVAETAKLLENSYRFINISFINELSFFCEKANISLIDVINTASSKPYGFMPFFPSMGAGGHCIPVDPIYLYNLAQKFGVSLRFIELAQKINQEMPLHYLYKAKKVLGTLENKRILVIGIAYKSNVSDIRESPAIKLIDMLRNARAQVSWHDDLVKEWRDESSTDISDDFDLAIIVTRHCNLDFKKLNSLQVIDSRNPN
jgi:UDP-N-acetyl-D-glucosamine dehydrogenase